MTWLLLLVLLVAAMIGLQGICAERRFARSLDPVEPREWEQAVFDELRLGRTRSRGGDCNI